MEKRQIIVVGSGLAILLIAFGLNRFFASLKEPPEEKKVVKVKRFVKTRPVKYQTIPTEIIAYGRVKTAESLDLIAEVSGRMVAGAVTLKEGQSFKKGTLIYRIDDTESRLNLQSEKSNFLRDIAGILPDLKIDFTDNYDVWFKYFESLDLEKSLPEIPKYKSSKEKTFLATKNIFSSYYSIKSKEANLRKYRFYAPFNGTISGVNLQSGSYVNPGNNIGKLLRLDKLELRVDVSTNDIDWIEMGTQASVSSEAGKAWNGKVIRIGEFINPQTQSIDVFIALDRSKNRMYDGEYLKANVPGRIIDNGMIMPRNAIFNGNEVFVLEDSVLKVHEIDIHKLNNETAVFSGLQENAQLVVEPLINAHNNMKAFKMEEGKDIDVEEKKSSDDQLVVN